MRILHLSSESSWRGGEQQIAYLIESLDAMGIQPIVACKPESKFEALCVRKGWGHYPLQMRSSADFRSGLDLKKLCRKLSIDLIHAHTSHGHGATFLAYLMGNKTPVVLTRRVDFEVGKNRWSKFKYTFPQLKKIACVSNKIRDIVINGTGAPEIATTIYSSINHAKFAPHIGGDFLRNKYNLEPTTRLIGNTSAIVPHKDYFTFVKTAEYYVQNFDTNVRFLVIGQGSQQAEIKDFVRERGLEKFFIFTGFLDNISEVLPSLDLFLMTSKTEGLGTSVIDAFASKIPVVATRAGGIPELVQHSRTGLLADIGDFRALASNIAEIMENAETRVNLLSHAYERSLELNIESMGQSYFNLYEKVLSTQPN